MRRLSELVRERREANPGREVEVWAFDERRLGLRPVSRRQWAPRGQRPIAVGRYCHEWLHPYGFVHPGDRRGGLVRLRHGRRRPARRGAGRVRRGGRRRRGQAGHPRPRQRRHVSGDLVVPPGIGLAFLPPYTPQLQPAEHLPLPADEALANEHFATLAGLDAALGERCRTLAAAPEAIEAATRLG